MPRYFFHVQDGQSISDNEGTTLADLNSARTEALRFTGQLLADDKGEFWERRDWRLDVTDASGLNLFSLVVLALDAPAVRGQAGFKFLG